MACGDLISRRFSAIRCCLRRYFEVPVPLKRLLGFIEQRRKCDEINRHEKVSVSDAVFQRYESQMTPFFHEGRVS